MMEGSMKFKQFVSSVGWEGALLGAAGLMAFILGLLDFTPLLQLTNDPIQRMILSSIGLLLGAMVVQTARRRSEIEELKNALGISEVHLLKDRFDFGQTLFLDATKARRFISNSFLNSSTPGFTPGYGFSGSQAEAHRLIYKRVLKGEIEFRHVVIIYYKQLLEDTIFKLLLHEGHRFIIRHYDPPPAAIQLLNVISFDDDTFYIGGFHTGASGIYPSQLCVKDSRFSELLKNYWYVHWEKAIPLNEGVNINWDELKRIGSRLGLSDDEFESMVSNIRNEVQRMKRKLPKP